jgi:hypothetical protein
MKTNSIKIVQMIPLRRCGSHAIRLRLGFDPDFYSPYPLHMVDLKSLIPLYGDLTDDRNYFQMTVDLVGLQSLSLVKWEGVAIDPIIFFDQIKTKKRSFQVLSTEILIEAARQRGKTLVMDKSLDNVHDWSKLIENYPEILFLNVIRDPRAQVASMNNAIIHEFDSLLNAKIWYEAVRACIELIAAHPHKVLTVRYEDFVQNQESVLQKICRFLEIPFIKEMLDVKKSAEAQRISVQSNLWQFNHSAPILQHIDKYKQTLTEAEIAIIENVCSPYMSQFGYERSTSANLSITEAELAEAKVKSQNARALAWSEMKIKKPQDYILRKRRADYIELCRRNLLAGLV